jgi:hypothetical protein
MLAGNPAVLAAPRLPSLSTRRRRRASEPAAGRLQTLSRAGVVVLLLLAVANGVFLYLLPGQAEAHYAWAIAPPINAGFMGAGYLAGTVATALVVFAARSWRSLRMLPLPLVVLSVGLLVATLMHADRFRWDYPLTWMWTGVYAVVPFVVAGLWRRQERVAPAAPVADPSLRGVRLASAVLGAVLVAGSLALFVAPGALADLWPWPLTDLLARTVASWYALIGTSLLVCGWSLRRPTEAVIPYATLLAWSLLLLLLALLHAGDLVGGGVELGAWVAGQCALVALAAFALVVGLRARAAGELL